MNHKPGTRTEQTCQFCHKWFTDKYVCKTHEKTIHQKKGLLECEHCSKKYTNTTSLIYHLFLEHSVLPTCPSWVCSSKNNHVFKNFKLYTQHRRSVHRNYLTSEEHSLKKIPCPDPDCKKEISRTNMSKHIRSFHNVSAKNTDTAPESKTFVYKFVYPHCEKTYKRKDHLSYHIKSKHESILHCIATKSIACPKCGKQFSNNKNLDLHIRDVHNTNKYPCKTCGKLFSKKFNQLRHSESCKHDKSDESDISDD